jgi:hypothetical protein
MMHKKAAIGNTSQTYLNSPKMPANPGRAWGCERAAGTA